MKDEDFKELLSVAGPDRLREFGLVVRNETIDEVVEALKQFTFAFGADTVDSFTIFIKGLKDD